MSIARGTQPGRTFEINVDAVGGRSRGRLRILAAGGEATAREVSAGSCDEVASALALVTALAIDPDAPLSPKAHHRRRTSQHRRRPPRDDATLPWLSNPPPHRWSHSTPTHRDVAPRSAVAASPDSPRPRRPVRWSVGFDGQSLGGFRPRLVARGRRFRGDLGGNGTSGIRTLLPAFAPDDRGQLNVFRRRRRTRQLDDRPHRDAVRGSVLAPGHLLGTLCAALDGGVLRSEGIGLPVLHDDTQPWTGAAGLARLGVEPRGRRAWLEAAGGVSLAFESFPLLLPARRGRGWTFLRSANVGGVLAFGRWLSLSVIKTLGRSHEGGVSQDGAAHPKLVRLLTDLTSGVSQESSLQRPESNSSGRVAPSRPDLALPAPARGSTTGDVDRCGATRVPRGGDQARGRSRPWW